MNVLLATGQFDLRLAIELLLRQEPGVDVVGSASETEGLLALVETTQPHLVVLDWSLPGRPGASVLADILASDCHPQLLVISEGAESAQLALDAGANAVTLKGAPPRQFLTVFRELRSKTN